MKIKQALPKLKVFINGSPEFECKDVAFREPEMMEVKGGTFWMGTPEDKLEKMSVDESPEHKVMLNDFYIGKYAVTVGE